MTKIPESAKELINSGAHAHLVTLNADGSPQVTLVWACLDGDDILTAHLYETHKVRNMRRDGRVANTFERRVSPNVSRLSASAAWVRGPDVRCES